MTWTIQKLLKFGKEQLKSLDYDQCELDARLLLEHVLGCNRVYLLLNNDKVIDQITVDHYSSVLSKRIKGKPIQYIIGEQDFMGITIGVNEHTLIPRPETEELVEYALEFIHREDIKKVMDIGTGSGCIPIALSVLCPDLQCMGLDISKKALEQAKKNAVHHHVQEKITWIKSNLFSNVKKKYGDLDMIISNPPYIPKEEIDHLMREVKDYEPLSALDGGEDGLNFYRDISLKAKEFLKKGALILYEVGHDQCNEVVTILEKNGYNDINYRKDLSGIYRFVSGRK